MLWSEALRKTGRTQAPTKLGYATYNEGNNTVWVKASGTGIDANPAFLPLDGGQSVITVTGFDLPEGIQVTAFNGDTAVSNGITSGTGEEQSAILSFPANTDSGDKVYIVKMSIDGGANWSELTTTVTVAAAVPDTVIDNPIISGVTPPAKGAVPVSEITETAQYNGIVTWQPTRLCLICVCRRLSPLYRRYLDGVPENFFTVAGATQVTGQSCCRGILRPNSGRRRRRRQRRRRQRRRRSGGGGGRDSVVTAQRDSEYAGMLTKLP